MILVLKSGVENQLINADIPIFVYGNVDPEMPLSTINLINQLSQSSSNEPKNLSQNRVTFMSKYYIYYNFNPC